MFCEAMVTNGKDVTVPSPLVWMIGFGMPTEEWILHGEKQRRTYRRISIGKATYYYIEKGKYLICY
jgi:hypothetical protein